MAAGGAVADSAAVIRALREQAAWCARLGSPLYATLLEHAARDVEADGAVASVLAGREHDPAGSMLALRFLGAVHRLVLAGRAPELAAFYPSAGGDADPARAWPAFRAAIEALADEVRAGLDDPVQTNEPRRAAALLGGFLLVARETGLPLRLLEIGASGGLNLRWDRYRYETPAGAWGDPSSPVQLRGFLSGGTPPLEVEASVAERSGCDRNPLDSTTREGRIALMAYVWPDQIDRLRLLAAAVSVARRVPATVERADAVEWLERRLTLADGTATVLFHSIFVQYVDREARIRMRRTIERVGAEATPTAPLAWLRMEPAGDHADVRLSLWPGGGDRLVATSGFHGADVNWRAGP